MMTKDKERDDALIAEALMGVVNATRAYLPPDGIDEKTCINRILEATDNPEMARIIQRIEERQPKPDRAEALAWMIEGLFAEAADNPCTCASDENSCPHCNAWERATKQTRACIVEAIDELRAEWEAERPAVVVPFGDDVIAAARFYADVPVAESRIVIMANAILDGAKGDE